MRQCVREQSIALGFGLVDQTKIVTAASELARNTMIYGGGGEVAIEPLVDGARRGLQARLLRPAARASPTSTLALKDGYTTGGGLGLGLGGAKRLSNEFAIDSRVGERHARDDHAMEMSDARFAASVAVDGSERRSRGAPQGSRRWRRSSISERRLQGSSRSRVTELGSNIVKHARAARSRCGGLQANGAAGIEVLAIDRGPGIANIARMHARRALHRRQPGTGPRRAPAPDHGVRDLYSGGQRHRRALRGLAVRRAAAAPGTLPQGALSAPKSGRDGLRRRLGDLSWHGRHALFVVDGLGHGPDAAVAARAAMDAAAKGMQLAAVDLIAAVHDALRPTRGAAAAVAMLRAGKGAVHVLRRRQHRSQHPLGRNVAQHGLPQRHTRAPGAQVRGFHLSVSRAVRCASRIPTA